MKSFVYLTAISIVIAFSFIILSITSTRSAHPIIAIVQPAIHPAMDEITQGVIDTLKSNSLKEYEFKVFNAQGDKSLMRAQAQQIVGGSYAAAVTIGASASQMLAELTTHRNRSLPVVFCGVSDPDKLGIVDSLEHPGHNVTGVIETQDYNQQLQIIKTLMPTLKRILLVYDPLQSQSLESDKQQIEQFAHQQGIVLETVAVSSATDIATRVPAFIERADVVLMLKDHTVVSSIDSLITLCIRHRKPLYASDLNSADKGAALAYGITEYDSGVEAAQQVLKILDDCASPAQLPVSAVTNARLKINRALAAQQGLMLSGAEQTLPIPVVFTTEKL